LSSQSAGNNNSTQLTPLDAGALYHFHDAIRSGKHWYIALLEAIGMWQSPEEIYQGRHYRYLIDEEAFDWVLLAERLIESVDGSLPEDEKSVFLLHDQPPLNISKEQLCGFFGEKRYRQHLNYYYGVTVERALVLAVQDEIRKERQVAGYIKEQENADEAFRRIYGQTETVLLEKFRRERRYRRLKSISLEEYKEFTYWLFKYRVKHCDKERVASDTRKALEWVNRNGIPHRLFYGQQRVVIGL
jgi:hypothetical protein